MKSGNLKTPSWQINPLCNDCKCHTTASPRAICLRGRNVDGKRKLLVFTDHPDYFADHAGRSYSLDVRRMLDWLFARMSIDPERVAYDYTLRCYAKGSLPTTKADRAVCIEECSSYRFASIAKVSPRAIAVLGQVSLEAFTGRTQIGNWVERAIHATEQFVQDYVSEVWVGYSINYILTSPSDTPSVFRVLYSAAQDAGLNPKLNPNIPPFQWRNLLF